MLEAVTSKDLSEEDRRFEEKLTFSHSLARPLVQILADTYSVLFVLREPPTRISKEQKRGENYRFFVREKIIGIDSEVYLLNGEELHEKLGVGEIKATGIGKNLFYIGKHERRAYEDKDPVILYIEGTKDSPHSCRLGKFSDCAFVKELDFSYTYTPGKLPLIYLSGQFAKEKEVFRSYIKELFI